MSIYAGMTMMDCRPTVWRSAALPKSNGKTFEQKLAYKIDAILGPHSGVSWSAVLGGKAA